MTRTVSALILAALVTSGCFKSSTSTSPTTASAVLGGTWSTSQSIGELGWSCTNFKWAVTQFDGSTGSGTFTATCLGYLDIAGSAQGTLNNTLITWSATATATAQGTGQSCPISLSGTAVLETDRIRIPYSGTVCGAAVSGTEYVKR
jgi:hypothetical protein